jgi:phage host-nuclease inhibitor protein Gam
MTDKGVVETLCALARHGEAADEIDRLTDALHDEISLRQAAYNEVERLRAEVAALRAEIAFYCKVLS